MSDWYYANDGQQLGPVDDARFAGLVTGGVVHAATLVWRDGMNGWLPYQQYYSELAAVAVAPAATGNGYAAGGSAGTAVATLEAAPAAAMVACMACRQYYPADAIVSVVGWNACAHCKPLVLERVREGVLPLTGMTLAGQRYAGFWIRFAALFLDGLILLPINSALSFVTRFAVNPLGTQDTSQAGLAFVVLAVGIVLQWAIAFSYEMFFVGRFGATPGKMICGLRVVRADGSKVSYARATGRYFAKMLGGLILYVGYLMVAFDPEKRGLHDQLCDTRVIHK